MSLLSSMADFVPYDRLLQKGLLACGSAGYASARRSLACTRGSAFARRCHSDAYRLQHAPCKLFVESFTPSLFIFPALHLLPFPFFPSPVTSIAKGLPMASISIATVQALIPKSGPRQRSRGPSLEAPSNYRAR